MGEGGSAIDLYRLNMYFVAETDEVVKETKIIYHTYSFNTQSNIVQFLYLYIIYNINFLYNGLQYCKKVV